MIRTVLSVLIIAMAVISLPISPAVQAATTKTITLDIQNMTCGTCPITVKYALKKVPGVIDASADFASKTATVSFDPEKASVAALIDATTNAGYPSTARKP